MAHTLQIIYGGTTLDLNDDSDILSMDYSIGTPRRGQETITETIKLRVDSTSVANLQTEMQNINRALLATKDRRLQQRGARVYLTRQLDGEANTYRSEILDIESWPDVKAIHPKPFWDAYLVIYYIRVTRVAYWENNTEDEIALSNNAGTAATGGRVVYNPSNLTPIINGIATISYSTTDDSINDSGDGLGDFAVGDVIIVRGSTSNDGVYTVDGAAVGKLTVVENLTTEVAGDTTYIYDVQNFVHIAASEVIGDMDAPCRIEITDTFATGNSNQFHIGHNTLSNPATLSHILEAEHASGVTSTSADAACSGGEYATLTWAVDTEATLAEWTIPTEVLAKAAGGDFRALARFQVITNVTDTKFRLKILYGSAEIFTGKVVQPDSAYSYLIRDLGIVTLPPWFQDSGTMEALTLRLTGKITGGTTIKLDCIALHCLDGYRYLEPVATGIPQNSRLVDDGILGELYVDTGSATARAAYYNGRGRPIMLKPNTAQRLYFLTASSTANTAEVNRTSSIRVYYRDRRLTI
jgi:hypothetical protein